MSKLLLKWFYECTQCNNNGLPGDAGKSPRTRVQNQSLKYPGYKLQNPEKVVKNLWERLDREYGGTYTIEALEGPTDGDGRKFLKLSFFIVTEGKLVKCDPVFNT